MNDFFEDLERVESRSRFFDYNGQAFTITCTDPYGFWNVRVNKARKQPEFTESAYSTYPDAERACKIWAEAQPKVPAQDALEELLDSPAPTIKYKKTRVKM